MNIYLDFDGTVVEHVFPKMGRFVPNALVVIARLKEAGHKIILNTYRADCNDGTLEQAILYLKRNTHTIHDIVPSIECDEVLKNKKYPERWDVEWAVKRGELWLDDNAYGIPLMPALATTGSMVNWAIIEEELAKHGLFNKID